MPWRPFSLSPATLPKASPTIKLTLGQVADANAEVILARAFASLLSEHMEALKPFVFVIDNTGISNASQNLMNSAALLAPFADKTASNFSVSFPSSS